MAALLRRVRRAFAHGVVCVCLAAISATPCAGAVPGADEQEQTQTATSAAGAAQRRPASLIPLYVSFATLQALDIHSTRRAIAAGASEVNPVVGRWLGEPVALTAAKAGVAVGIVMLTERFRKQHPRAATLTMVGLNAAMTVVVAHNYSVGTTSVPAR